MWVVCNFNRGLIQKYHTNPDLKECEIKPEVCQGCGCRILYKEEQVQEP